MNIYMKLVLCKMIKNNVFIKLIFGVYYLDGLIIEEEYQLVGKYVYIIMRYNVDKVDYILDYLIMDYIWVNQIIVIFQNFYYGVYQSILLYLQINYNDVFY